MRLNRKKKTEVGRRRQTHLDVVKCIQYFQMPLVVKHRWFRCLTDSLNDFLWISSSTQGLWMVPYLDDWVLCGWSQQQVMSKTALDLTSLDLKVNYAKSHLTPVQTAWHMGHESLFDRRQSFHNYERSHKTMCGYTLPICRLSNSGRNIDSRWWMACTAGHMKCLCREPDIKRHT